MLSFLKDSSSKSLLLSLYNKEKEKEGYPTSGGFISLSHIWSEDVLGFKLGDRFQEDFLVVSIQPFLKFFNNFSVLPSIEVLDSRYQKDYDLGILLEHKQGFRVLGIIKYRKFRLWSAIPEIGSRYRFSGFMERWINGIKGDKFVCWGCRLEGIES